MVSPLIDDVLGLHIEVHYFYMVKKKKVGRVFMSLEASNHISVGFCIYFTTVKCQMKC